MQILTARSAEKTEGSMEKMSRTAVITGGSRGIGRAVSLRFAEAGYSGIAIIYHSDEAAAETLAAQLRRSGTDAECYKCDVASYEEVKKTADDIIKRFSHVDVLVNNAGVAQIKLLIDQTEEDWEYIMGVNAKGVFNCCRHFLPHMLSRKSGRIVNISSMWGITGASCEVAYSASKAAVIGFTKALAQETGPSGVTVNCVAPGVINTEMNASLSDADVKALCDEIPLMRIGQPEETAEAVLFLASDAASYITGQVLSVNGGMVV